MPIQERSLQQLTYPSSSLREPEELWRLVNDEENAGLSPILAVLRRRLGLIAGVTVIVTTVAAVWAATLTPKYEGRVQLLVEPLQTADSELLVLLSETLKQDVNEITRHNNTALDYQALMEVLKSPKLLNPVVNELQSRYPDISYDQLVGSDVSGHKLLKGREGTLYINRLVQGKEESRVVEVRYQDTNPEKIQVILERVVKAYQNYSKEQQQTNLRQGVRFVEQQIPKSRQRVTTLQGQLQSFQQQYGVFNPELQGEQLLKRLDELQAQQRETERQLAEAKSLSTSLKKQLGMLEEEAIAASALSESPQYQEIGTRVREIEAKIAAESTRLTDSNPVMLNLKEERKKLLRLLEQEAKVALGNNSSINRFTSKVRTYQNTVRRDLTTQLVDATNQVKLLAVSFDANNKATLELNQKIKKYPAIARNHSNLQRELQVATDTLNQLLAKQEALRVDVAQQEIPWELIMPPTLPRDKKGRLIAVSLQPSRTVLLGGVVGVLLGIFAAFVLENVKNVFYDPEEVKRKTKLPLLGVIPFQRNAKLLTAGEEAVNTQKPIPRLLPKAVKYQDQASSLSQAFYSLYSRVHTLRFNAQIQSLIVTYATLEDSKSTVAINLAKIAAQAGLRVLLVDADLRYPHVHTILGLVNRQGLSEVLSKGLDLEDVIGQAPQEENLFVVTAGEKPKNPAKLFSSVQLDTFIERSQTKFDLVIYDAPPVMGLLDTSLLASRTNGVLFVVGLGKTTRTNLQQALDELKAARIPVLGMIANNKV
ncbi:capsular biosynthesis protein [Scytonema hofmannii PCC 7110]|uniref:non-specific protein-tyrosine kinase n=1 Tax=Scytonema hofmannii PCC 7110 TaxID=128403 RepID=A0A139WU06_9CYAN|nr:polysaccharide biosynthesis tyrosine autokinase [Scytonema hofmannii]KYC35899.1 capsular biosynthesis protein [Scytonema hofmannii PCC 7110]